MNKERILRELSFLREGGLVAELVENASPKPVVLYRDVPSGGECVGVAPKEDVIVPVPDGYPGALIDGAGLTVGNPLLPRLQGGGNDQGRYSADNRNWQLASYHPHNGGGGPSWDQMKYGFHTYIDHLIAWLHRIS